MICVIGGAGYIGSHCVQLLLQHQLDVVVLDNLELGHRAAVLGGAFVEGDFTDASTLDKLFQTYPVDCVMHLAAYASVADSMSDPARYYQRNVIGAYTLLEAMRRHHVPHIIFSSSAATYGEPVEIPITESHPQVPTNAYGESKRAFEQMLHWYDVAYGLKSVSLRYFNAAGTDPTGVLGEDHSPETHLIPLVIDAALGRRPAVKVFGTDYPTPDGTCIRDYIHVTDLADAHLKAVQYLREGGPTICLNLGNGLGHSVRQVIDTVAAVGGRPVPSVDAPRRPGDPARLVASSDLARQILHWTPQHAALETIVSTVYRWREAHPEGYGDRA